MAGKVRALGALISDVLATFGHGDVQARQEREDAWRQIVDPRLGPFTSLNRLQRGVLEVTVQDAVTMQELAFSQESLLGKLQSQLPHHQIRGLRFRVGSE